ncbi:hypothetical protein DPMN_045265 [Dreissena polymorpha]|uniref:Uncharacterized protein n=1 Tax=Dreissena polymorpha TaxID=45954 RepID=A0A9D4I184_DREPO|nr:hypothetical protein DPMN_045265 [Dreissena polymorpha]
MKICRNGVKVITINFGYGPILKDQNGGLPWFFALDHPNYARWLSIHVRDTLALGNVAPSIAKEFKKGHFVVKKTHHAVCAIAIDHAHKKNNKLVKGDGVVIGLTGNASYPKMVGMRSRNGSCGQ